MLRKARFASLVLAAVGCTMLLGSPSPARAQVGIGIGITFPGVSIGIDVPAYPELVQVPGYPVYYDARADSNYFFYDGLYWVYLGDDWYVSSWYDGPWQRVRPEYVPVYVLRVPVRYYRHPPAHFRGWYGDAPPRWGEHWGRDWEARRAGWDKWDRRSVPPAAPLPVYQRQYAGDRYPRTPEQQHSLRSTNYRYEAREPVTRQFVQSQPARPAPQAQPSRPTPEARPAQPAHVNRPQAAPQQAREDRAPPQQQQARENRAPPQQQQARENRAPPQQGRESYAAPQGKGQEKQAASQGKGQEKKAASQDQGRENRKEERGQDRH